MKPVCRVEDVPLGEGRALTLDGTRVALFRTPTGWFATSGICPHRGGPLADGIASDCQVICPLHERRYALDTGAPVGHDGPGITSYPVEVRDDVVHVALEVPAAVS